MQAALALSPGDAVKAAYSANPTGDEARRYTGFATEALTIAVFEILIAGTLGTLLIRLFAPLLLKKVQHAQILPERLQVHTHSASDVVHGCTASASAPQGHCPLLEFRLNA